MARPRTPRAARGCEPHVVKTWSKFFLRLELTASRSLAVKMRLALLLAAALGVHADVQAPDMDPERKAEIAKKVREFQDMTRQNPALARPNTDAMYAALGKSRNCSHHILDIFADRGYENEEKQSVQLLRQCKTLFYNETVPFTEETKGSPFGAELAANMQAAMAAEMQVHLPP